MKRTFFIPWILILGFVLSFMVVLTGCDSLTGGEPTGNITELRYATVPHNSNLNVSTAVAGNGYELIYSAYDSTSYYYLFLLGKIKYVPVASSPYLNYNGVTPQAYSYTRTEFEGVSITESLKTAVNKTFYTSTTTTAGLGVQGSIGWGPFEVSVQTNIGQEWRRDETESRSFTDTYTTETTKSFEEKSGFATVIGEHGEAAGCYRYAFFTDTDVYYVVKTNKTKTAITESHITLCNRPGGSWYLDYTPDYDSTFIKTAPGDLLKVPVLNVPDLPTPTKSLGGNGSAETGDTNTGAPQGYTNTKK
jgi:hypothetical protein